MIDIHPPITRKKKYNLETNKNDKKKSSSVGDLKKDRK